MVACCRFRLRHTQESEARIISQKTLDSFLLDVEWARKQGNPKHLTMHRSRTLCPVTKQFTLAINIPFLVDLDRIADRADEFAADLCLKLANKLTGLPE